MKATVKTLWISMLLVFLCGISGQAADFVQADIKADVDVRESSATLSLRSSSLDGIEKENSSYTNNLYSWSSVMELGTKSSSENYTSNQQRLRRMMEDNLFLKNIILILSSRENLLTLGKVRLCYSDQSSLYSLAGSDYYIFRLRRILI